MIAAEEVIDSMLPQLQQALYWFVYIFLELSILLLVISFAISIVTSFITPEKVKKWMDKYSRGLTGNIIGTALGGLLPFCSCSTIPALIGLLNVGVPFRIAMSFLIASPLGVLNLVVISLFSTMFGPKVAIMYIVATFIAAVLAGVILDKLGLASEVKDVEVMGGEEETVIQMTDSANCWERWKPILTSSWDSAWTLYKQMIPFLLVGVGVGAWIYGFVPTQFFVKYAGPKNPFAVPIAAAIGIPMYVRTETMVPICSALVKKGVGLGTVMALIIGGAGASIPELSLLAAIFKRKLFIAYIVTIFVIASVIGYAFNFLFVL